MLIPTRLDEALLNAPGFTPAKEKKLKSLFESKDPRLRRDRDGWYKEAIDRLGNVAQIIQLPDEEWEEKLSVFAQCDGLESYVLDAFRLPERSAETVERWADFGKRVILFLTDEDPIKNSVLEKIGKSGAGKYVNMKGEGSRKSERTNIRTVLFRELAKAFGSVTKKE